MMQQVKSASWVVYLMTLRRDHPPMKAVCMQSEWEEMERVHPGYHTLVQSGITDETEAEKHQKTVDAENALDLAVSECATDDDLNMPVSQWVRGILSNKTPEWTRRARQLNKALMFYRGYGRTDVNKTLEFVAAHLDHTGSHSAAEWVRGRKRGNG